MTKAIIFDLGGVLIDNPNRQIFSYFEEKLGLSYDILYPSITKFWKEWEKGLISENELWQMVGADLKKKLEINEPLWLNSYTPAYREKKKMFDLLSLLKTEGYQTALLSNIEDPIKEYIVAKNYQNIDTFIFSCEVKMSKPDKEIYDYTLDQLKISPQEAIFVDDRKENIEAANSLGITGLHFQDYEKLADDLKNLQILNSPSTRALK